MNSMHQRQEMYKELCTEVPKDLQKMFSLGYWTLAGQRIMSIRGNMRMVTEDSKLAKKRAWRLLANERLRNMLPSLLTVVGVVKKDSIIAVDFSHFGKWQVLMFAVQTRSGRAIPVFFKIITYPIEKGSQNIFVVEAIEEFVGLIGFRPKLVMDRGFACPYIIKKLAQHKHIFYIRIKAGKHVLTEEGSPLSVRSVQTNDVRVIAYELNLRLVISDVSNYSREPWYLITNDKRSSRNTIIQYYYFRFEIEEFFKDAKWLQGLEHTYFKKIESITTLLWFVLIGWWSFDRIKNSLSNSQLSHPHDQISLPRLFFESLLRNQLLFALSAIGVLL